MKKITVWVKKHPYLIGSFVIGAIIVWFLIRRMAGSGSSVSSVQSNGVDPQAAAQAYQDSRDDKQFGQAMQLRQFDLSAQLQVLHEQGSQDIAKIGAEGAVMSAHDLIDLQKTQTQVKGAVDVAGIQAAAQVQTAQIESTTQLGVAGINRDIASIVSGNQLAGIVDTNRTNLGIAGLAKEVSLAGFQRDITITQLQTDRDIAGFARDISLETLDTNRDISVANILSTRDISLANILSTRDISLANIEWSARLGISSNETNRDVSVANIASNLQKYLADKSAEVYHDYFATDRYSTDAQVHIADNVLSTTRKNLLDFFDFSGPGKDAWGTGANQATALATLFGNTAIGVAAQGSQTAHESQPGNTPGGILNSIFSGVTKVLTVG
jgi:hypothetical protein